MTSSPREPPDGDDVMLLMALVAKMREHGARDGPAYVERALAWGAMGPREVRQWTKHFQRILAAWEKNQGPRT